jgi:hypothetical protein
MSAAIFSWVYSKACGCSQYQFSSASFNFIVTCRHLFWGRGEMSLHQRKVCPKFVWWMTSGQQPKTVKTLLAPPRGPVSGFAVEIQPIHQKHRAEIGCAGPKWCKQLSLKTVWTSNTTLPIITPFSERSEWANLSLDDKRRWRKECSLKLYIKMCHQLVNRFVDRNINMSELRHQDSGQYLWTHYRPTLRAR